MPRDLRGRFDFRGPPLRQRSARHPPVTDIAVGDGNEFDVMPEFGPLRRGASVFVLGIIGMSAEADDPQFSVALFLPLRTNHTGPHAQQHCGRGNDPNGTESGIRWNGEASAHGETPMIRYSMAWNSVHNSDTARHHRQRKWSHVVEKIGVFLVNLIIGEVILIPKISGELVSGDVMVVQDVDDMVGWLRVQKDCQSRPGQCSETEEMVTRSLRNREPRAPGS